MGLRVFLLLLVSAGPVFGRVEIIRSDSRGVAVSYYPGPMKVKTVCGRTQIEFDDAEPVAGFGEYDLPARVVRLGIAQQGDVRLNFRVHEAGTVPDAEPATVDFIPFEADRQPASADRLGSGIFPASPVEIDSPQVLRSVRFVTLRFNPVQYDARRRQLVWFDRIEAELEFEQPAVDNPRSDPLDEAIVRLLANGGVAKNWKIDFGPQGQNPFDHFPFWLKLVVDSTGIYRITGQELAQAGVGLSGLDPRTVGLWTVRRNPLTGNYPDTFNPVALMITGTEDGRFDPGDTLIFYALGADYWMSDCSTHVHNLYTGENVYWLTWGAGSGRRIPGGFGPDTAGTPVRWQERDVLHQEVDADCPARAGLLWIWATLDKPADRTSTSFTCRLDLKYPVQIERIRGRLYNETAQNEIEVLFNNRPVSRFQFAQSPYPAPYDFVVDSLLPADFRTNILELRLSGNGEKRVHLDYLQIRYRRRLSLAAGPLSFYVDDTGRFRFRIIDVPVRPLILDVTDPDNPRAILDFEFHGDTAQFCCQVRKRTLFAIATPQQLRRVKRLELKRPGRLWAGPPADYYIITPREFLPAASELARYRNGRIPGVSNGRAEAVVLDDIYDEFNFGLSEPRAVKRFLQEKRPGYVLLVGDATYDYRNNLRRTQTPGVPTYEIGEGFNPESGDRRTLALDAWYADLEGEGASPDLILGRVCVRSGYELREYVRKVIEYENQPAGYWHRRFFLLADDEYQRYPDRPDELRFRHIEQCEGIGVMAGDRFDLVKVYLTEFPFLGPKSKPGANQELMRQLNLGALIWFFFGHGSAFALTHEEVLTVNRLSDISNGSRTPFCFMGSCSVGRFDDTRQECIGEELVRMSDGAIACVAASTATPSGNNLVFARNLLAPLLSAGDTARSIGFCFFQAWPTDRSYHLFGDPAVRLQIPRLNPEPPVLKPETLATGSRFRVRSLLAVEKANTEWRLFGPVLNRTYNSPLGISAGYSLPGSELARGNFRLRDGRFYCEGIFPRGIVADTIFTGNGYYAPLPGSCRFSAVLATDSGPLGVLRDRIEFTTALTPATDSAGPSVIFRYQGRVLKDDDLLPADAQLEIVLEDPSGILLAPIPGMEPVLMLNDYRNTIPLADRLIFDDSSYSCCRCRVQLNLEGPQDSIFVSAADNLLNSSRVGLRLRPVVSSVLKLDSVLVYPNPVRGTAFFTFTLSQPAAVRIRIWTLSGRLVRDLGIQPCGFGYNQIFWDGNDGQGVPVANGIYLFTVTAEFRNGTDVQRVAVRDKLLVQR